MIQALNLIDPGFRMIVLIRDPVQIFGSIDSQHDKTRLVEFPDHLDADSASNRARSLFSAKGVVGGPLKSIENMLDIEDDHLRSRLCYVDFSELVNNPASTMAFLFDWAGLMPLNIDPNNLQTGPSESDSHYNLKFPHRTYNTIKLAKTHMISRRIKLEIQDEFSWFYEQFYPDLTVD